MIFDPRSPPKKVQGEWVALHPFRLNAAKAYQAGEVVPEIFEMTPQRVNQLVRRKYIAFRPVHGAKAKASAEVVKRLSEEREELEAIVRALESDVKALMIEKNRLELLMANAQALFRGYNE